MFNSNFIKKILIIALITFLGVYVARDISYKMIEKLREQGSSIAIMKIITLAENENCEPFSVYAGEKIVNLININCLQQKTDEEELTIEENNFLDNNELE